MSEEIFIKENGQEYQKIVEDEKPPRKKRTLSPKQLAALEKGRKKMEEKRKKAKEEKLKNGKIEKKEVEKEKKILKESKEDEKTNSEQVKKTRKKTKENKLKNEALQKVMKREDENKKVENFEKLKYEALSKVNNVNTFRQLDEELNKIDRDTILNHENLVSHLTNLAEKLIKNQRTMDIEDIKEQNKI